jgi:lauroyl/myristoyl acyltransferase
MSKTKKIRRKIRYSLVYRFVQFFIFLSNILPRVAWLKFSGVLGRIAFVFASNTRKLVISHLKFAYGSEKREKEIRELGWGVFEMLGKNTGEMLRATRVKNLEELEQFNAWVNEVGSIDLDVSDPAGVSDRMVVTLQFHGNGKGSLTETDKQDLLLWAQTVFQKLYN